ncbi:MULTISPECIES: catalase family peroxidase [Methylobacterium]|jgi:catalase|uniref:catalase family peroxidase n=1 Tax=Methylobacterium TaxID=407 RepID=UPI0008F130DA|nr:MULTISPECIES: catalase family peroxidase [Methylobacterium]MBZ6412551.1 catalase family peroxidase [Methylobacterium sp.]MBK3399284.1 catalase family peroxidase [Methylobacterium ajmalii]MBK3408427.1 catalase family peroxidase [Methylobacterium ajmalii]MBK3425539.1 catalase family peroxidase [Methylobacterium ajmalii]SFF04757.1 catalase [Methylobacterium sp. yr596]
MIRSSALLAGAAALAALAVPVHAEEADPAAIVGLQFAVSGNHKGVRASGAKGVCLKGSFAPAPDAASLSKAPQFTKTVPVTARFSMGGGNPKISDKTKATTRGFAMRMADPAGDMTFVIISAPVFSTKTPAQLEEFLKVRVPGPDGKPDAEKIKAFAAQNPETGRQAAWLNARPVPASFAGTDYWAVHAYTLTNAKGDKTVAKLKFVAADKAGLSDEELKAKPDSFYADELKERLAKGPARFDLVAILAQPGDPTADVTATWPEEERKTRTLGTLAITAIEPDATCDAATFDPVVDLPDGIAGPADDPMFAIRSPAYAVSLSRRSN